MTQLTWMCTVPAKSANEEREASPAKLVFGLDGVPGTVFELEASDHQQLLCLIAGLRHLGVVPTQDFLFNPATHTAAVAELTNPASDTVMLFGTKALTQLDAERRQRRIEAERQRELLKARREVISIFIFGNSKIYFFIFFRSSFYVS